MTWTNEQLDRALEAFFEARPGDTRNGILEALKAAGPPTKDVSKQSVHPWEPLRERTELKILGKLLEELGELTAAVSRCIIQGGIDEVEPTTGKPNSQWLMEELADVSAGIFLVCDHYDFDEGLLVAREEAKIAKLREWHAMQPPQYFSAAYLQPPQYFSAAYQTGGACNAGSKTPDEPTPRQSAWSRFWDRVWGLSAPDHYAP